MYIEKVARGYARGGEQRIGKGRFLILSSRKKEGKLEMRAIVRSVAMHQMGHWMMSSVEILGHRISLSGSYGGDGLPLDVPDEVWEQMVPVPQELVDAWSKGGGHNEAGSEAPLMAKWARENLKALTRPLKREKGWTKVQISSAYMRRCTVTRRDVHVSKSSTLGFGKYMASPGDLIVYKETYTDGSIGRCTARVIGRVDAPASGDLPAVKGFLMVLTINRTFSHAYVRWVDPKDVEECLAGGRRALAQWFMQETLPDPLTLVKMDDYGSLSESYIDKNGGLPPSVRKEDG